MILEYCCCQSSCSCDSTSMKNMSAYFHFYHTCKYNTGFVIKKKKCLSYRRWGKMGLYLYPSGICTYERAVCFTSRAAERPLLQLSLFKKLQLDWALTFNLKKGVTARQYPGQLLHIFLVHFVWSQCLAASQLLQFNTGWSSNLSIPAVY